MGKGQKGNYMTVKKPAKCIVPAKEVDEYCLTGRDLRHLLSLVSAANRMLSYYVNMPENLTGELAVDGDSALANKLDDQISELANSFAEIYWR